MTMAKNPITRRDVLKTLAMGVAGGSVLQSLPLQAAQHVHRMIAQEKSHAPAGRYRPKFWTISAQVLLRASVSDAFVSLRCHHPGG